jgi:pSer/pThr/pTyr-binding forkhead associated (FHA) protein
MEEELLLVIRLGLLAILYLFLWVVISAVWRDLRRARERSVPSDALAGMPRLHVVEPGASILHIGQVIDLQPMTTVGRGATNTLVVQDETISGRHAAIEYREGRWWIHDLGSTNGTYVNRRRLVGTTELRPGDLVHAGRVAFQFGVEVPHAYGAPSERPMARAR